MASDGLRSHGQEGITPRNEVHGRIMPGDQSGWNSPDPADPIPIARPMNEWYAGLLVAIADAELRLMTDKQRAPESSEWERELKYQMRAFRSGVAIIKSTKPAFGESQDEYVTRLQPALQAMLDIAPEEVRDYWRAGVRELLRVMI